MQWSALALIWRAPRLLGRLGLAAAQVARSRRRALAGFRSGLAEEGVPEPAIDALSEAYPAIDLKTALGAGGAPVGRNVKP
jgi:hypothetical protein